VRGVLKTVLNVPKQLIRNVLMPLKRGSSKVAVVLRPSPLVGVPCP